MFDIAFLDVLRRRELELVVGELELGACVLEFGAGSGTQARELRSRGFTVIAIDLPASDYSGQRVFPVIDYDGYHIPLSDGSVDIIYSSNVLEHVSNLPQILAEFRRTLKPDGYCVHLMPSVAWRAWTFASGIPTAAMAAVRILRSLILPSPVHTRGFRKDIKALVAGLVPIGHGTSVEGLSELWTFSVPSWRSKFRKGRFRVDAVRPVGIFHTGHMLAGRRLSPRTRERLAKWIGSAANVFVIRPDRQASE
jgi:SAM-dependent methyltransferase